MSKPDWGKALAELIVERNETQDRLDEALDLLAKAWEWTARDRPGKLGYVDLEVRVKKALEKRNG